MKIWNKITAGDMLENETNDTISEVKGMKSPPGTVKLVTGCLYQPVFLFSKLNKYFLETMT